MSDIFQKPAPAANVEANDLLAQFGLSDTALEPRAGAAKARMFCAVCVPGNES